MAAQKQEKHSSKNEKYTQLQKKIKRKTIKSKSEYASRASPNGPLNIYALEKHDRLKTVSANDSQDNVTAT